MDFFHSMIDLAFLRNKLTPWNALQESHTLLQVLEGVTTLHVRCVAYEPLKISFHENARISTYKHLNRTVALLWSQNTAQNSNEFQSLQDTHLVWRLCSYSPLAICIVIVGRWIVWWRYGSTRLCQVYGISWTSVTCFSVTCFSCTNRKTHTIFELWTFAFVLFQDDWTWHCNQTTWMDASSFWINPYRLEWLFWLNFLVFLSDERCWKGDPIMMLSIIKKCRFHTLKLSVPCLHSSITPEPLR